MKVSKLELTDTMILPQQTDPEEVQGLQFQPHYYGDVSTKGDLVNSEDAECFFFCILRFFDAADAPASLPEFHSSWAAVCKNPKPLRE